jgi:hypothetical protein
MRYALAMIVPFLSVSAVIFSIRELPAQAVEGGNPEVAGTSPGRRVTMTSSP